MARAVTVVRAREINTIGGSAETEQQAVIVIPHALRSTKVVTTATPEARRLMECRNAEETSPSPADCTA
jgi:hypothetical protein